MLKHPQFSSQNLGAASSSFLSFKSKTITLSMTKIKFRLEKASHFPSQLLSVPGPEDFQTNQYNEKLLDRV